MKKRLSVMQILRGAVLLLAFAVCDPSAAWASPRLSGPVAPTGEAVLASIVGGKVVSLDVCLDPVRHSPLFYMILGAEDAVKTGFSGSVLLLFAKDGSLVGKIPFPDEAGCLDVAASPRGDILAVDSGRSASRTWTFYALPGFARLGGLLGYVRESQSGDSELVWAGDDAVLVPVREKPENRGRDCGEKDGCGRLSVFLHRIRAGETVPVFEGTPLCDYRPLSFSRGMTRAEKICAPTPEGWWKMENGQFSQYNSTEEAVPLPGGQGQ